MSPPAYQQSVADFLFKTPLYEMRDFGNDAEFPRALMMDQFNIDGHCPYCGREATFSRYNRSLNLESINNINQGKSFVDEVAIVCARNKFHIITFHLRGRDKKVMKAGQFPSFADIANDESKRYRSVLSKEDSAELHKAIGLAAHGVGIGAYVYIRRIFERLIYSRFQEFKDIENWTEEQFQKLRMAERIDLLKNHLPEFLVRNQKLYSILSLGIHELDEQKCLGFFEIVKQSTIFILEEDKRKKEELEQRKAVEQAIAKFTSPSDEQ